MIESILELVLGQIPESIFFALFMIYAKRLKDKKFLFTILITVERIALIKLFPYSLWSRIFFFMMTYLILKILYDEKSQITDVFTMGVASIIILCVSTFYGFVVWKLLNSFIMAVILNDIVLFLILYLIKDKIYGLQSLYKNWWNRNDSIKKPIKSVTFRAVNVIVFIVMFAVINMLIIIGLMIGGVK